MLYPLSYGCSSRQPQRVETLPCAGSYGEIGPHPFVFDGDALPVSVPSIGPMMSIGSGKTTVEFWSAPSSSRVCR